MTESETFRKGRELRRQLMGDAFVERTDQTVYTDPIMQRFRDLATETVFGALWTRPGLDRRTRSAVTLTALVALGHWEELALHVRAALRNGLTTDEVKEVLLQTAIYCGVPAANHAFAVAQRVLEAE